MNSPQEASQGLSSRSNLARKGRGRGRGRQLSRGGKAVQVGSSSPIQTETSKNCHSSWDSPTAARRPAQKLYQPGAFRKLKGNDDSCPEKGSAGVQLSCDSKISTKQGEKNPLEKSLAKTKQPSTEKPLSCKKDDSMSDLNVRNEKRDCSSQDDLKIDWIVGRSVDTGTDEVLPEITEVDVVLSVKADSSHISSFEVADSTEVAGIYQQATITAIESNSVSPEVETTCSIDDVITQADNGTAVEPVSARGERDFHSIYPAYAREKNNASVTPVCVQVDNGGLPEVPSTQVEDGNLTSPVVVVGDGSSTTPAGIEVDRSDIDPVGDQASCSSPCHSVAPQVDDNGSLDGRDVHLNNRGSIGSMSPQLDSSGSVDPAITKVDSSGCIDPVNVQVDKRSPSHCFVSTQVDNRDSLYPPDILVHGSGTSDPVNVLLDHGSSTCCIGPEVDTSDSIGTGGSMVDSNVYMDESDFIDSVASQVDSCASSEPFHSSIHNSNCRDSVNVELDNGSSAGLVSTENNNSDSTSLARIRTNNRYHIVPFVSQIYNTSPMDPAETLAKSNDSTDCVSGQVNHSTSIALVDTQVGDCVEVTEEKTLEALEHIDNNRVFDELTKEPPSTSDQDYNLIMSEEELDTIDSVKNSLSDNDRTNPRLLTSRKDDPEVEFKGTPRPDEAEHVISSFIEELKTNCDEDLAGKLGKACGNDSMTSAALGVEEVALRSDTGINDKAKPKSKRQCKKEEKAKKKEGKLKKKSKVLQKSNTAALKEDPEGKCQAKDVVKSSSEEKDGKEIEETKAEEEEQDDNWETNWDEKGECLNSEALAELSEIAEIADVEIEKPKFDYLSFRPKDVVLDSGVYDHVVEVYDFSPELKTEDLIHALLNFKSQGIHWVDDTHALAVFSSHITAQSAIAEYSSPMLKLRSLYDGTQESKLKAKRRVDILQPYKERPKTSKLVANRLVTGALGVRSKMSKEERQLEREKIKAEREKKLNKEKQKKDLWESEDLEK